jgi:hypothetical protein
MNAPYTSTTLSHFVGWRDPTNDERNYDVLSAVLREGILARPDHDGTWGTEAFRLLESGSLLDEKLILANVVCVADIPIEGLSVHCAKYGRFGLGFDRSFLVKYGFRPVMYFPYSASDGSAYGRNRLKWIEQAYRDAWLFDRERSKDGAMSRLAGAPSGTADEALKQALTVMRRDLLPFLKPFNADLASSHPESYYMEREWRRLGNLRFALSDVAKVYVARDFVGVAKRDHHALADRIEPI